MQQVQTGYIRGTGAAVNVSLGFIPDYVKVINVTDGDKIHEGFLDGGEQIMPFSGGGTTEIEVGDTIEGATSGATAKVMGVILDSGSWAGGDAAGWLVLDLASKVGTFQSENVFVGTGTDDATVTVDVTHTVDIDTEVAGATGNAAITSYLGSESSNLSPGFTIGSTISEDAKLLRFVAVRSGPGAKHPFIANSL